MIVGMDVLSQMQRDDHEKIRVSGAVCRTETVVDASRGGQPTASSLGPVLKVDEEHFTVTFCCVFLSQYPHLGVSQMNRLSNTAKIFVVRFIHR